MSHEDPLPQCVEAHHDFKKHVDESTRFRHDVTKHDEQILTLNKAHEAVMEDIKGIKKTLEDIQKVAVLTRELHAESPGCPSLVVRARLREPAP